jgi:hypothetical protein
LEGWGFTIKLRPQAICLYMLTLFTFGLKKDVKSAVIITSNKNKARTIYLKPCR